MTMKPRVEMRYAYQELSTLGMVPLGLSIMVLLTALFTLWDPLDLAHTLSGAERMAFSAFVASSDLLICYPCGVLVLYLSRFRPMHHAVVVLGVAALIVAAPCAAIMYAGYSLFHGGRAPGNGILELYAVNAINLLWTAGLTFYVLMLRICCRDFLASKDTTASAQPVSDEKPADTSSDRRTTERNVIPSPPSIQGLGDEAEELPGNEPLAAVDESDDPAVVHDPVADANREDATDRKKRRPPVHIRPVDAKRLLESLPEPVGQDVVYVHVSGHYLDVVTTSGSAIVLMRLADVVPALGSRGMQVHRSYWVAYRHIRKLVRRDYRMLLCLTDGYEVPVSRPFLPSVRDFVAGLSSPERNQHVTGVSGRPVG